ncbi:MAG: glycosyltransferase family 9 protein [Bacteroidota bacterium]
MALLPKRASKGIPPVTSDTPHLLVIRLSAMGDVAMAVPVLDIVTQHYPEVKLTMLSKPFFKPLFADIPNLHFYEADVKGKHKGLTGLWKLANELKALQIDAVADLHNVLRSNILKLFFRLKGIPVVQIHKGRKEKKALIRKINKIFKPLTSTHQRYANVFKQLGFPIALSSYQSPDKKKLPQKVTEVVGSTSEKWIGIAPFAAYKSKTYPLELMEEVIAVLHQTKACKLILFGGGQQEVTLLQQWADKYENVVNAAGVFSFEEELALISNVALMVAMDSGNAHLAAMYGIETITLWGVTHPFAGFYPFQQHKENALLSDRKKYPLIPTSVYGNTCPKDYEDVMHSIPKERLIAKIMAHLK